MRHLITPLFSGLIGLVCCGRICRYFVLQKGAFLANSIKLHINGIAESLRIDPRETLLDVIRERLGLTGTKRGCDEGACGACTVLLDGRPVNSCLLLAIDVGKSKITTIEGVATGGVENHPVLKSFIDVGAIQCGFCTPGMVLTTVAFLEKHREPTAPQIREALSGNLCRCTGYRKIIDAVTSATEILQRGQSNG